jgi:hypothetical protein
MDAINCLVTEGWSLHIQMMARMIMISKEGPAYGSPFSQVEKDTISKLVSIGWCRESDPERKIHAISIDVFSCGPKIVCECMRPGWPAVTVEHTLAFWKETFSWMGGAWKSIGLDDPNSSGRGVLERARDAKAKGISLQALAQAQ